MEDEQQSSLKQKLRSTICFSCCFRSSQREETLEQDERPRLIRSSTSWLRSELPELKDKYRNLISRIGKSRRQQSGDFRYDPLSYSLNFDDGSDELLSEEFRFRNFSSRLPPSPLPDTSSPEIEITCN